MGTDEDAATRAPGVAVRGPAPRRFDSVRRWGLLLGLTVVLAVLLKTFVVQAFYIPSTSMEPGLEVGDRILVEKVSGWTSAPERGDVVVFEDPGGWLDTPATEPENAVRGALAAVGLSPAADHLVKRVIGVGGDVVTCCDDEGRILVNDVPLEEEAYVPTADLACAGPMTGTCRWRAGPVPDGEVFVMGDNRDASGDSTTHLCTAQETDCNRDPFVAEDLVVGTVWATVWPRDRVGLVGSPPDSFDAVPDGP